MSLGLQDIDLRVERLLDRPIIDASTHPSIGTNIQGPSLIRAPDWLERPWAGTTCISPITRAVTSGSPAPTI